MYSNSREDTIAMVYVSSLAHFCLFLYFFFPSNIIVEKEFSSCVTHKIYNQNQVNEKCIG